MHIVGRCPDCGGRSEYPEPRCRRCGARVRYWDAIAREVLRTKPVRRNVKVAADAVGEPTAEGYESRHPNPTTEARDLRKRASDVLPDPDPTERRGIHVKDHGAFYRIHWDAIDPGVDAVEHLRRDVPGSSWLTTAIAGGALVALAATG